jgi:hypothetical protein
MPDRHPASLCRGQCDCPAGGTDGSNPVPSCAESAANFVFGREARKGPRRRQGTIPTVLIQAHALLHRASRNCNEAGAIIATIEDYAVVRALVADLFSEGIEATVPATVRETVDAVSALKLLSLAIS